MRSMVSGFGVLMGLALTFAAQASSTLRVGSEVLTAGDSAVRVTALLGKPAYKSHRGSVRSSRSSRSSRRNGDRRRGASHAVGDNAGGEQWQYRRGDHVTTVTILDGRVIDIQDRRR